MATVTVPSGGSTPITQTFDNRFNSALAQNIANALRAALDGGNLEVVTTNGGVAPARQFPAVRTGRRPSSRTAAP